MKIAIYGQIYHHNSEASITKLLDELKNSSANVLIESEFYGILNSQIKLKESYQTFTGLDGTFDLLISIGGDGTMLRSVTFVRDLNIPIIGINTGRLGFLATIQVDQIEEAVRDIITGNYSISERSLLCIHTVPKNEQFSELNFALNEIAVSRKNTTSMITVETTLDEEYLTSYWADGLIVSTPTGSTGYSLSCGGPVIMPEAESLVLTPIAPHNLNARPLVISNHTKIKLRVSGREDTFLVSLDSRIATLDNDTTIHIEKAPFKVKMIELKHESFLNTIRKKLLWGEDKRN